MIDTADLFYCFPSKSEYDLCWATIDQMARRYNNHLLKQKQNKRKKRQYNNQPRHKSRKHVYLTTAFENIGILQISLRRTEYTYSMYMMLQPIRLLFPGSHLRLSTMADYPEICARLNSFLSAVNQLAGYSALPPIEDWHVQRIDYAIDIDTPKSYGYVRVFNAGDIPQGFKKPKNYDCSLYLKSKHGNVNFYEKLEEVRKRFGLTDDDITAELGHLPKGLLRIEFQCFNPYILYLKSKYHLPETTWAHLYDAAIAQEELQWRVRSIVGICDFFPRRHCLEVIAQSYRVKTLVHCGEIMRYLVNGSGRSLYKRRKMCASKQERNAFAQALLKIRKLGINPIPLEIAEPLCPQSMSSLINPIRLIDFDVSCGNVE